MESSKEADFTVILVKHPKCVNLVKREKNTKILKIPFNDQLKFEFIPVQGKDYAEQKKNFKFIKRSVHLIDNDPMRKYLEGTVTIASFKKMSSCITQDCIGGIVFKQKENLMIIKDFALKSKVRGTQENFGLIMVHFVMSKFFNNNNNGVISLFADDYFDLNVKNPEKKLVLYYRNNFGFLQKEKKDLKDKSSLDDQHLILTKKEYIACLKGKFILLEDKFFCNCLYLGQIIMFLNENNIPYNIFSQQICKKV